MMARNRRRLLAVQRGVRRAFFARPMQAASVTELVLASGSPGPMSWVTGGAVGEIAIVEIKSSVADFRADRKWQSYRGLL